MKLTEEVKAARQAERKAKAMNTAAAKSFGPLFAHLAPVVTPAEAAEHQRRGRVAGVEFVHAVCSPAGRGLDWLRVWAAHAAAVRLLGQATADELTAHAARVYDGKPDYILGVLRTCLTTVNQFVLACERRTDPAKVNRYNPDGAYLVNTEVWPPAGYTPVMTTADFNALTMRATPEGVDASDDDPAGLFPLVMSRLFARIQ